MSLLSTSALDIWAQEHCHRSKDLPEAVAADKRAVHPVLYSLAQKSDCALSSYIGMHSALSARQYTCCALVATPHS